MKRILLTTCILLCGIFLGKVNAEQIKIACIGNSITEGAFNYPSMLGRMLGEEYVVGNYGVSGRTCLMTGDCPYMNEEAYQSALAFLPDIVVIKLGTNDSKYFNWNTSQNGELYKNDLTTLVNSFKDLETSPRVILCLPVPAFLGAYDISNSTLRNEIDPIIQSVAELTGSEVLDLNTPLQPYSSYFYDGIHPDEYGADLIAREVYKGITGDIFDESVYSNTLEVDFEKFYSLVNKGTGKILDSDNIWGILADSVPGSVSQRFVFEFCGYGAYKMKQYYSGNYLRVYNDEIRVASLDGGSYDFTMIFYPTDIPGEYLCGTEPNRLLGYNPTELKVESNHTKSDYTDYDIWYVREVPVSRLPLDSNIGSVESLLDKVIELKGYELYSEESISALRNILEDYKEITISDLSEFNNTVSELSENFNQFFRTINFEGGTYLFKRAGANTYWTNMGTNKNNVNYYEERPLFKPLKEGSNDQLFSITKQSNGRFKIESLSDVRAYINEGGKIRRDVSSFLPDWNTFNLICDGEFWAVQPLGWGASAGFWMANSVLVENSQRMMLDFDTDFIFELVPYDVNSINPVIYSETTIFVADGILQVKNAPLGEIYLFNVNGTMVLREKVENDFTKELPDGFYIVKLVSEGTIYTSKVVVK